MMTFLSEVQMNDAAQIILALAALMSSAKGIIWAIRCSKDSPNYVNPSFRLTFRARDDRES